MCNDSARRPADSRDIEPITLVRCDHGRHRTETGQEIPPRLDGYDRNGCEHRLRRELSVGLQPPRIRLSMTIRRAGEVADGRITQTIPTTAAQKPTSTPDALPNLAELAPRGRNSCVRRDVC